ncbi:hypothetical protein ABLN85_17835 [Mycobacterium tuberculosis]
MSVLRSIRFGCLAARNRMTEPSFSLFIVETLSAFFRAPRLRVALRDYTAKTVPALDIDAYAQRVYQANRAAGS